MALVDALQVSPARSRRRKKVGTPNIGLYSPKMSGGVRVEVLLLDGRKLEFSVGARLLTQDLMAMVTSHFALRETQYFALAHKDHTGHYHWLLDDRRLLDHDFARSVRLLPLHFLVRFFPLSVTELRDAQAVELFYQQARNVITSRELDVEDLSALRLAALSLQASIGNYIDEQSSKSHFKKSPDNAKRNLSEEKVCAEHRQLIGLSRGDAILSYMRQVEGIPGYGIHYYEVKDRSNIAWLLGINQQGIAQYDNKSKKKLRRLFCWKQLENLYFRERKFSIEVHDPKRVSVSRRTLGPGNVSVYVWFAETQSLCKSIWSMAIAQHQFYLDRKTSSRSKGSLDPPDLVGDLSRSCVSLSTHSSSPNLSRSGSHSSLHHTSQTDSASTESLHAARMELLSALQQRYDAINEKLDEKTEELKLLCMREGELTGELPSEYPRKPGEPLPVVRKRVGTAFLLDETLISKIINKQEETVASLELDYEIQAKIVSASLRLANDSSSRKGLRKGRKHSYQQATQRLRDIEEKLRQARNRQAQVLSTNTMPKMKKKPRPVADNENTQDDFAAHELLKESSVVDGVALSPHSTDSSSKYKNSSMILHSAPASPQRSISGHGSPSESSSGPSNNKSSRSNSPARPLSGYIPSVVYTRNQYRAQHFPTLSTRGQSVPGESLQHQRSFNGGLYNLPQQRTSLASHSLDDLDSSSPNLPPHPPPHNGYTTTPTSSQHSKPPHLNHRSRHETPPDRFGSLDRRRAACGRVESRSMDHLDSLPPSPTMPSPIQPSPLGVHSPQYFSPHYDPTFGLGSPEPLNPPPHLSFRTPDQSFDSKLSRNISMETSFAHGGDTNQENIPPAQVDMLLPLRASNTRPKRDVHSLRSTASVNAADHLRPLRIPVSELPPLRPTKSSSELPPLKPTNGRIDSPAYHRTGEMKHSTPVGRYEEPRLLSLAEGARIHKERERTPSTAHNMSTERTPSTAHSVHNMSTSSVGSSGSSGSVFHSPTESDATLSTSSLNATLTVITTGSYQPSREVSKPFEMADFYKYSTKFRRKSSSTHEGTPEPSFSASVPDSPKILNDLGPPSPSIVAMHSAPGPQQKGVYQPLTPLTCQPISEDHHWENSSMVQAVPVNVTTNKRAATLV